MSDVLETLNIVITAETKDVEKATANIKKSMSGINKAADTAAAVIAGVGVAVGTTMIGLVTNTTNAASAIADSSKRVGMSAEEYQKWAFAAKQSGIEIGTLETLMKKQQTVFADATNGSKTAADAYKKLGVNVEEWTSSEAFEQVILKLSAMKDETQRNAIANDLFGKSYADLAPLLAEGSAGIDALRQQAVELGGVMSNESIAAGDKFGDTIDQLKTLFGGLANDIGLKLMPTFQKIADWIIANKDTIIKDFTGAVNAVGAAIGFVADNIDWILPLLAGLAAAFIAIKLVMVALTIQQMLLNLAMNANPIGLIILAIAALVAIGVALYMNWDKIVKFAGDLWSSLKDVFGKIGKFVGDVFKGIINGFIDMANFVISGLNLMIKAWLSPFNALIKGWNDTLGGLIGKIPEIKVTIGAIPKLANGGMIDAGSLFVAGESGKELIGSHQGKTTVMPLENTSFVAAMGESVYSAVTEAFKSLPSTETTLTVDGLVLAKATENNLNKLSTLQGGLKIAF